MRLLSDQGSPRQAHNESWVAGQVRSSAKSKLQNLKSKTGSRRGATVVLVAVCMAAIVGVIALALDGGVLFDKRRSVQAAADAAALAAADDLWTNYSTFSGVDSNGTARASALATATADGFNNDGSTSIVTVNVPPQTGIAAGKAGYVEVVVQANQSRSFSAMFGSGTVPVQARAVACGNPANAGVITLDPVDSGSFYLNGFMYVMNNLAININSSAGGAGQITGSAGLWSGGINVVGTLQNSGYVSYTGGGTLKQGVAPAYDPFAGLAEPSPSGTSFGSQTYNANTTISPGIYNGITIGAGVTVTMQPGIYFLGTAASPGSGLTFQPPSGGKPGGTLVGNGVMIYNSSGDHINPQPAGAMYLTAPTTGTYKGIVLYQPRSSTTQVNIATNQIVVLSGALYAQNGSFNLSPNGTGFEIGAYVGYKMGVCQGASPLGLIVVDPGFGIPTQRPKLVE